MIFSSVFRALAPKLNIPLSVRHLSKSCVLLDGLKQPLTVTVNPYCKINVKLSSKLEIYPCDLLDCPDANLIRATLASGEDVSARLCITTGQATDTQQEVCVTEKLGFSSERIFLHVPVKADLNIESSETVKIADFHSDDITIHSLKGIETRNLKSRNISIHSNDGEIVCQGTILAYNLKIKSDNSGSIKLDKVQGDFMEIQSNKGGISINSCYSQTSKIKTNSGNLDLKNIHKNCEINVEESSDVQMTGFNGNLLSTINKGSLNCQMEKLHGESVIVANNETDFTLNLSEEVCRSTYVHASIGPTSLVLDPDLETLKGTKENGAITLSQKEDCENKLFIQTQGNVTIKKQSWADSIKMKF